MEKNLVFSHIPTQLTEAQFALIVFPHLTVGRRGPNKKLPLFSLFNYILKCLYLGCQWKKLPIKNDSNGRREIHYTTVYRSFRQWSAGGCFDRIFSESVSMLARAGHVVAGPGAADSVFRAPRKFKPNNPI